MLHPSNRIPTNAAVQHVRADHRSGGFTLVEVLMVVIIIGIAGAVVVPQMLRASTLHIQAASRMVIADLLYAQHEAIARGESVKVVFEPDTHRYFLTDANGNMIPSSWRMGDEGSGLYAVDFIKDSRFSGVRIAGATFGEDSTVTFDGLGAPDDGGTITLTAAGDTYVVNVTAFTGRVTVAKQ